MDVAVYNIKGEKVGQMPIDESSLGGSVNPALIKQAYVIYHANLRQGSARSKGRSDVEGSKKKLYKQKGTGNARHGSKRPPQFRGGGHYKSDRRTREDFRLTMPKKMKRAANRNALLAKLLDNEVRVVDTISLPETKTAAVRAMLASLNIDKTALLALSAEERSEGARRSARNLDGVSLCRADQLTCFEMLNHRYLVIEKGELEAWLSGPSSQTGKDAKLEPKGASETPVKPERKARPKRGFAVKQAVRQAKLAAAGKGGH